MDIGATNLNQALTSPDTYAFVPGIGYVDFRAAPPVNPFGARGRCSPPPATLNMSWHALISPNGEEITFQWLDRNCLWMRVEASARRIAFSPDYLSSHGWTYAGLASSRHE